ncbi:feruloyl esterase [Longispora fulva]|uniref:Feruloyl esterase n=1 Tax=Longispora fulva TaxID=619741 RepID=A0A8J7KG76_9ACTN|nr:tannase/feruloyl esterase family alpha/beta hydrolase [Longispora fulva]MBG6134659.1 feruloyl esterase [Longispora fulva]GIG61867.1 feruloyl esterase [Longispora fulva]
MRSTPTPGGARRLGLLAAAAVLLGMAVAAPAASAPTRAEPATAPAAITTPVVPKLDCSALPGLDLTAVPDAPSRIVSAATVTVGTAAFCDIKGYISPQTQFELKLPVATWRGQYVQLGCGGLCGDVPAIAPGVSTGCAPVNNGELAIGADNQGHLGANRFDGLWAKDDPQLRAVFGVTSEHSMAQLAKAVIGRYYGQAPTYAYYDGCSGGGREGLIEAQRYPDDFDGILSGAPAFDATDFAAFEAWIHRSNTDGSGRQILGRPKLPALHTAVLTACAGPDGLIDHPRTCAFEPATLQCPADTDTAGCLTADQVTVVRKFYTGPVDARGRNLYPGGLAYGSELAWAGWDIAATDDPAAALTTNAAQFGLNFLKYLAYEKNPPASYTLRDFEFTDSSYARLQGLAGTYNATNPDLAAFRKHGGKIILYHGWADQAISPFGTVAYYGDVVTKAGGYSAAQSFSRLYMMPGQYHCLGIGGGDPLATADLLTPLMSWVQEGQAPGAATLTSVHPAAGQPATIVVQPMNPLTVVAPTGGRGYNTGYRWIGRFH